MKKIILVLSFLCLYSSVLTEIYAGELVLVLRVKKTMMERSILKKIEEGSSGGGALAGGLSGAATGFYYGGFLGAAAGSFAGAMGGNYLNDSIRDKKTTATEEKLKVPVYIATLSNGQTVVSVSYLHKGQRIDLDYIKKAQGEK